MATRFRTQDTKANWARKLNTLFGSTLLTPPLRDVPQTLYQWQRELNAAVTAARAAGFAALLTTLLFRLQDTRQMWARKLNEVATIIEAGPTISLAISTIAGNDIVVDAEAASVAISGTSVGLADGTTVTIRIDGTLQGTTTVSANAWTLAAQDLTALANGAHTVTATAPNAADASRAITRADT